MLGRWNSPLGYRRGKHRKHSLQLRQNKRNTYCTAPDPEGDYRTRPGIFTSGKDKVSYTAGFILRVNLN